MENKTKYWNRPYSKRLYDLTKASIDKINHDNEIYEKSLTKKQKEILEEFNQIESNKPDPVIKSFFEKAKKFWRNS